LVLAVAYHLQQHKRAAVATVTSLTGMARLDLLIQVVAVVLAEPAQLVMAHLVVAVLVSSLLRLRTPLKPCSPVV
jgi:hypothetical protein